MAGEWGASMRVGVDTARCEPERIWIELVEGVGYKGLGGVKKDVKRESERKGGGYKDIKEGWE